MEKFSNKKEMMAYILDQISKISNYKSVVSDICFTGYSPVCQSLEMAMSMNSGQANHCLGLILQNEESLTFNEYEILKTAYNKKISEMHSFYSTISHNDYAIQNFISL